MSDGMSTRPNPLSRSNGYDPALVRELIMGPNSLKLCEETLDDAAAHGSGLAPGSLVLDLGSGSGLTSAFLAAHIYLAISGLTCDVADFGGALPAELSCSWTPEQLEYLWPRGRWERLFAAEGDVRVERIRDLSCNDEAWRDWVACDNPYAAGDRAAIEAGALAWLTTTEVVLRRL